MLIREIIKFDKTTNKPISDFLIVKNSRIGDAVVQETVLFLGHDFTLEREKWLLLINRILDILDNQQLLWKFSEEIEDLAQSLAAKILEKRNDKKESEFKHKQIQGSTSYLKRKIDNIKNDFIMDCAPAGLAMLSLWVIKSIGLTKIFARLNFDTDQLFTAQTVIAARMERPASELSICKWLRYVSVIGDLIGFNFNVISESSFYRIVDKIVAHREKIESFLFAENRGIYSENTQLLLYDLTNSYLEGKTVSKNKKRGHSKEKRADCLLVSLAIFVDYSGFIKKSFLYPGNISEPSTLATTLEKLNPDRNVPVVMDRGIPTADDIEWLIKNGFKYIVANR
jgi:hypothetical protein